MRILVPLFAFALLPVNGSATASMSPEEQKWMLLERLEKVMEDEGPEQTASLSGPFPVVPQAFHIPFFIRHGLRLSCAELDAKQMDPIEMAVANVLDLSASGDEPDPERYVKLMKQLHDTVDIVLKDTASPRVHELLPLLPRKIADYMPLAYEIFSGDCGKKCRLITIEFTDVTTPPPSMQSSLDATGPGKTDDIHVSVRRLLTLAATYAYQLHDVCQGLATSSAGTSRREREAMLREADMVRRLWEFHRACINEFYPAIQADAILAAQTAKTADDMMEVAMRQVVRHAKLFPPLHDAEDCIELICQLMEERGAQPGSLNHKKHQNTPKLAREIAARTTWPVLPRCLQYAMAIGMGMDSENVESVNTWLLAHQRAVVNLLTAGRATSAQSSFLQTAMHASLLQFQKLIGEYRQKRAIVMGLGDLPNRAIREYQRVENGLLQWIDGWFHEALLGMPDFVYDHYNERVSLVTMPADHVELFLDKALAHYRDVLIPRFRQSFGESVALHAVGIALVGRIKGDIAAAAALAYLDCFRAMGSTRLAEFCQVFSRHQKSLKELITAELGQCRIKERPQENPAGAKMHHSQKGKKRKQGSKGNSQ